MTYELMGGPGLENQGVTTSKLYPLTQPFSQCYCQWSNTITANTPDIDEH